MRLFELEEKNGFGHQYLKLNLRKLEPRVLEVDCNRGLELDEAGELKPGESLLQTCVEYIEFKRPTYQASAIIWLALGPEDIDLLKLLVSRTPYQNRSNALTPKEFTRVEDPEYRFAGLTWCRSESVHWNNRGLRTESSKRKKKEEMRAEAERVLCGKLQLMPELFVVRLQAAVDEYNKQFVDRTHDALKYDHESWGFESDAVLACDREINDLRRQLNELQGKWEAALKDRQAARNKEILKHYLQGEFGYLPTSLAVQVETALREGRCFEATKLNPVVLW